MEWAPAQHRKSHSLPSGVDILYFWDEKEKYPSEFSKKRCFFIPSPLAFVRLSTHAHTDFSCVVTSFLLQEELYHNSQFLCLCSSHSFPAKNYSISSGETIIVASCLSLKYLWSRRLPHTHVLNAPLSIVPHDTDIVTPASGSPWLSPDPEEFVTITG